MNEVINSIIAGLNNVGQWFWDYAVGIFVQSSVLIVLLLIVDFLLRKRVRAVFRYCVWMLVFVKLLLPTSFALPTGIGYWLGDYWASQPSLEKAMPDIEEAVPAVAPLERMIPAQPEIVASEPPVDEIAPVETAVTVTDGSFEPAKIRLEPVRWQGLVFLGWLVGMFVFSVLLVQRARFVKGLLAQAKEADRDLLDLLRRCRKDIGVRENVKLKLSANMVSPAVCGIFSPTILLPGYLVEKLSGEKLRAILIHELAHIKRRDMWVNVVQSVLQIVYFYNPFVWLANAMVRRVREQAVDEMVLVALGKEADGYSNTLIDIGEMAFWRPNLSLRMIGVVESKKALASRIRHIASRSMPRSAKVGILGLIAVVIIGAILLPMAKAERTDAGIEAVRENSQAQVKRLIKEAEDYFARLGKAKKRRDWSEVERWAERLRDVFGEFKSAITVHELRARVENLGEITRRQEKKLQELEHLKQTIEAYASDQGQLRELRRLIHNVGELSDELHSAIRDEKLYLVRAIYDELNRQWRGFRAIVRARRVRVPRAARSERLQSRRWIDILELIDVERDVKGGNWRREDGTLIGFAQSTLETTYELPCEYDILWEFESNSTAINLLLASPLGKRFEWMMKGWSHRLCGIREVDCKPVNANETTAAFPLESGVRYVAEVRVRKGRFVALINGEQILNYKTDWSDVEVCKPWHPFELQGRRLGLWLNKHWTKIYRLQVKPYDGRLKGGKRRERDTGPTWITAAGPARLESDLVAYWRFDEGSGTTAYDSASNNHGTIYGAKWTADGALRFDGEDDYVDLGYAASLKASLPVTLSGWIKRSSSKSATFFALDEQRPTYYGIWLNTDRNQVLEIAFGDGQGGDSPGHRRSKHGNTVLSPNIWYHVAAVIRGPTDMDLYINGQDDGGYYSGSGGSLVYSSGISRIGAGNVYFDGEIDEVMIFDGTLSAEEIRRIYKRQRKARPITRDTGPELTEGISGKAYYFDGKGDFINIFESESLDISGDQITVSAWIKAKRIDKRQVIVSKTGWGDNTWLVEINPIDCGRGKLNFYLNAGGRESNFCSKDAINVNTWYHVVFVYDGDERIIYINGQFDGREPYSGNINTNDQPVRIGSWGDPIGPGETRYFNGAIDEVAIYKRALSSDEIQQLYENVGRLSGSGLAGYWSFDADDGDVVIDSSPYHNDGKLEDRPEDYYRRHGWATRPTAGIVAPSSDTGPELTEGIRGKAYYFDGAGDYINIDESESLDISGNEITVSAWIKADGVDRRQVIAAKTAGGDNTWLVEINPVDFDGGKLNFYLDLRPVDDNFGSKTAITAHRWYHVAFVYDGTQRIIYVNGRVDASQGASGNIPTNNQPVRIGGWGSLSRYFKGSIDEVVLFNRALSGSEIRQLYENPGRLTGNEPGLVGYWNFDADDGDTVIDSSPYRNHGKLRSEGRRIHRGVMSTRID